MTRIFIIVTLLLLSLSANADTIQVLHPEASTDINSDYGMGIYISSEIYVPNPQKKTRRLKVVGFYLDSSHNFVTARPGHPEYTTASGDIYSFGTLYGMDEVDTRERAEDAVIFIPYDVIPGVKGENNGFVRIYMLNADTGEWLDGHSQDIPVRWTQLAATGERASKFSNMHINHNVMRDGEPHMAVYFDLMTQGYKGVDTQVTLQLTKDGGRAHKFTTHAPKSPNGSACIYHKISIENNFESFEKQVIYIANKDLCLDPGQKTYTVRLHHLPTDFSDIFSSAPSFTFDGIGHERTPAPQQSNPNIDPDNMKRIDEYFARYENKSSSPSPAPQQQQNQWGVFNPNANPFHLNNEFQAPKYEGGSSQKSTPSSRYTHRLKERTYVAKMFLYDDEKPIDVEYKMLIDGGRLRIQSNNEDLYNIPICLQNITEARIGDDISGVGYLPTSRNTPDTPSTLYELKNGKHYIYLNGPRRVFFGDNTDRPDRFVTLKFQIFP